MGRIPNGIMGGVSGRVGNVVGSNCCGVYYLRALPRKTHRKPSAGQMTQRGRFAVAQTFVNEIKDFVRTGYHTLAVGMHARNAAISYTMHNALAQTAEGYEVVYSKVLVSRGIVEAITTGKADVGTKKITFSWAKDADDMSGRNYDRVLAMAYNRDKHNALYDKDFSARRRDETATLAVPADWVGDTLELYLGFISEDGAVASNSAWLGSITVPEDMVATADEGNAEEMADAGKDSSEEMADANNDSAEEVSSPKVDTAEEIASPVSDSAEKVSEAATKQVMQTDDAMELSDSEQTAKQHPKADSVSKTVQFSAPIISESPHGLARTERKTGPGVFLNSQYFPNHQTNKFY
jgi:hypothetical protein